LFLYNSYQTQYPFLFILFYWNDQHVSTIMAMHDHGLQFFFQNVILFILILIALDLVMFNQHLMYFYFSNLLELPAVIEPAISRLWALRYTYTGDTTPFQKCSKTRNSKMAADWGNCVGLTYHANFWLAEMSKKPPKQ
jgi:hypothetical protein